MFIFDLIGDYMLLGWNDASPHFGQIMDGTVGSLVIMAVHLSNSEWLRLLQWGQV